MGLVRFHGFGDRDFGFTGPFGSKAAADHFHAFAVLHGCASARVQSLSGLIQTSDNSPCVVNVSRLAVDAWNYSEAARMGCDGYLIEKETTK